MKLKTNSLILLLFAALVAWPAQPARGDGDGVGILPYYQGGDDEDPEAKVDGNGTGLGRYDLTSGAFGFLVTQDPSGHQTVSVFPIKSRVFSWRRLAVTLANSKALVGYKFAVGLVDASHQIIYVVTAKVDGGSGRAPLVQIRRY